MAPAPWGGAMSEPEDLQSDRPPRVAKRSMCLDRTEEWLSATANPCRPPPPKVAPGRHRGDFETAGQEGAVTRLCAQCRRVFEPRQRHHYLCFGCWSQQQAVNDPRVVREIWDTINDLLRLNRELFDALEEFRAQIPRLLQLCHPDRHENSEASNRATSWLLDLRSRPLREAA